MALKGHRAAVASAEAAQRHLAHAEQFPGTGAGVAFLMPAWGGHDNGRIPADAMRKATVIEGANGLLRTDASLALDRLGRLALAAGYDVRVTDLYRTYATQVRLKAEWCARKRCQMAATPGTSNHGWGDAVDNGYSYGPKSFGRWMHANAATCRAHGWFWPTWAQRTRTYELWHWEYLAALDKSRNVSPNAAPPPPAQEDDDMIRAGQSGPEVREFQELINNFGVATGSTSSLVTEDGVYGPATQTAVRDHVIPRLRTVAFHQLDGLTLAKHADPARVSVTIQALMAAVLSERR